MTLRDDRFPLPVSLTLVLRLCKLGNLRLIGQMQVQALSIVFVLSTLPCEAAVSTPSFFEAILDASQQMTSATDYDRKFLDELKSCWSTFDPE